MKLQKRYVLSGKKTLNAQDLATLTGIELHLLKAAIHGCAEEVEDEDFIDAVRSIPHVMPAIPITSARKRSQQWVLRLESIPVKDDNVGDWRNKSVEGLLAYVRLRPDKLEWQLKAHCSNISEVITSISNLTKKFDWGIQRAAAVMLFYAVSSDQIRNLVMKWMNLGCWRFVVDYSHA